MPATIAVYRTTLVCRRVQQTGTGKMTAAAVSPTKTTTEVAHTKTAVFRLLAGNTSTMNVRAAITITTGITIVPKARLLDPHTTKV